MLLPLHTDSPLRSTPWMNWALIAANIIVFLIQFALWGGNPPGALSPREPEIWQYFTYQFLHGDGWHIAGNMLFLWIFGNNVNDRMGHWGYLAFYLAGGVFAGIGQVVTSSAPIPIIGASGAISAVTGAYLALLPRSRITIVFFFYIIGTFEFPCIWFILLSFIKDFIFGFSQLDTGVAHLAHFSGSVFGFIVSFTLLATQLLPRDQFDLFALFKQWNRRRQYRDMVRSGYDPFAVTPARTRQAPDPRMDQIQDLRGEIAEALSAHKTEEGARLYLRLREIDPQQVLARQNQLDVANQLFADGQHAAAADAYEGFLRMYPKYDQVEQVQLMLGILYSRYLNRPDRAREFLSVAVPRLRNSAELDLARAELAKLGGATT